MQKAFGISLALCLVPLLGCTEHVYKGNEAPTAFRAVVNGIPSQVHDSWVRSLFITPTELVDRCGQPSAQWLTGSNKSDSEYAIIQTHFLYRNLNTEAVVSRYPNAKRELDRNWFFAGLFAADRGKEYSKQDAIERMQCISDKVIAWYSPPSPSK
jgi:Mg2+ and Co2+ transporter CorA